MRVEESAITYRLLKGLCGEWTGEVLGIYLKTKGNIAHARKGFAETWNYQYESQPMPRSLIFSTGMCGSPLDVPVASMSDIDGKVTIPCSTPPYTAHAAWHFFKLQ
jgi:hypothetical protein